MTVETFQVAGMSCGHCVQAVSSELGKLPGVERVEVDLPAGAVTVRSQDPLDRAEVLEAIDEAGFELLQP